MCVCVRVPIYFPIVSHMFRIYFPIFSHSFRICFHSFPIYFPENVANKKNGPFVGLRSKRRNWNLCAAACSAHLRLWRRGCEGCMVQWLGDIIAGWWFVTWILCFPQELRWWSNLTFIFLRGVGIPPIR
jgi:hypothetical protein